MDEELKILLAEFKAGTHHETRHSYERLSRYFAEELLKVPFVELSFSNYRDCYNKLGQLFHDNGLITRDCRMILHRKEFGVIAMRLFDEKGNYYYKNAYNTEEVIVKCKERRYTLKYRRLVI